jgi:hypothetical protein
MPRKTVTTARKPKRAPPAACCENDAWPFVMAAARMPKIPECTEEMLKSVSKKHGLEGLLRLTLPIMACELEECDECKIVISTTSFTMVLRTIEVCKGLITRMIDDIQLRGHWSYFERLTYNCRTIVGGLLG